MKLQELTAISPVDGRYRSKVSELAVFFSEFGLMKYRVYVEIEYFIALCEIPLPQLNDIPAEKYTVLRGIVDNFSVDNARHIKDIEKTTNHDVKAVEYFVKEKFNSVGLDKHKEFVHFGLTSQDINNTAVPLSYKHALDKVYYNQLSQVTDTLDTLANEWRQVVMLARTHGQPASPTRLGKEILVFSERINKQLVQLRSIPFSAKFGGATGNMNAHVIAYPQIDWNGFATNFVNSVLQLQRSYPTTQIEHYDNLAASFDALKRINTILIDLCRDIWTYISMDYFKQKIKKGEIGSSAMPHKVNPIDFENAEGNLGMANAFFEHLSAKLPISRLQRDLTDSTVLRNIGVPLSHTIIALQSIRKGLGKLLLNEDALKADLEKNWSVVAEGIQSVLRREGYPNPYEALLQLTRTNKKITAEIISGFIDSLNIADRVKEELKQITPFNYTGK